MLRRLGIVTTVAVGTPPILLLAIRIMRLTWSGPATRILAMLGVAIAAILVYRWLRARPDGFQIHLVKRPSVEEFCLALGLLVAVISKLQAVADLPAGLWGDSLQHTMIAQLIVDNGGLFDSWMPYASLASFTYHFGFHANVAFFHWLSGMPVIQATMVVGQLLQVASMVTVGWMTSALIRRSDKGGHDIADISGAVAALLVGLANLMPAYTVNWGRYPQLAGLTLLPGVILGWIAFLEFDWFERKRFVFAVFGTVALALTHYLVTLLAILMLTIYLVFCLARRPDWATARKIVFRVGPALMLVGALAGPWYVNTLNGNLNKLIAYLASTPAASLASHTIGSSKLEPITPLFLKGWLMGLSALGVVIGVAKRHWHLLLSAIWAVALIGSVTPATFGLPGTGTIEYITAYSTLYVFSLPFAGFAVASVCAVLSNRQIVGLRVSRLAVVCTLLGLVGWGARWQLAVPDRKQFQLLTSADLKAFDWIRSNTPSDARFLINGFPAYGGGLIAGNDGGWWLQLLTLRQTSLPPLPYGTELGIPPGMRQDILRLALMLRGKPLANASQTAIDLTTASALEALKAAKISHIFSGSHRAPENSDYIDTAMLRVSPNYALRYEVDDTLVFEIIP